MTQVAGIGALFLGILMIVSYSALLYSFATDGQVKGRSEALTGLFCLIGTMITTPFHILGSKMSWAVTIDFVVPILLIFGGVGTVGTISLWPKKLIVFTICFSFMILFKNIFTNNNPGSHWWIISSLYLVIAITLIAELKKG